MAKYIFYYIAEILVGLKNDKYLAPHRKYYTREMRIVVYS